VRWVFHVAGVWGGLYKCTNGSTPWVLAREERVFPTRMVVRGRTSGITRRKLFNSLKEDASILDQRRTDGKIQGRRAKEKSPVPRCPLNMHFRRRCCAGKGYRCPKRQATIPSCTKTMDRYDMSPLRKQKLSLFQGLWWSGKQPFIGSDGIMPRLHCMRY